MTGDTGQEANNTKTQPTIHMKQKNLKVGSYRNTVQLPQLEINVIAYNSLQGKRMNSKKARKQGNKAVRKRSSKEAALAMGDLTFFESCSDYDLARVAERASAILACRIVKGDGSSWNLASSAEEEGQDKHGKQSYTGASSQGEQRPIQPSSSAYPADSSGRRLKSSSM